MRRSGFTLIELIFVMVVIGVLAAVALPKFKGLKNNAELTNVITAYTNIVQNASASFFNETELNGVDPRDLNMTNFLKVENYNPNTGKGWYKSADNRYVYYYIDPYKYIRFYYNKSITDPAITIFTYITGGTIKDDLQRKLQKKIGLTFVNDRNTTTIHLLND